jgi:DNA-binding GntR family transcriptional regulator
MKEASVAESPIATKRTVIVDGLLADIFRGQYAPGERLITEQLAKEFGVSQTPIREAIGILAGMGVVIVKPNCGAVVRRFKPREVREICQVRRILECEAILTATGKIDRHELNSLKTIFQRLSRSKLRVHAKDLRDVKRSDTKLHDLIREACTNRFLVSELQRLMNLVRAIRDAAWDRLLAKESPDLLYVVDEAKQHLAIVDALLDNNPMEARKSLAIHLRSGAKYIVHAVEE